MKSSLPSVSSAQSVVKNSCPISRGSRLPRLKILGGFSLIPLCLTGCQVLTYTSPTGERFSRSSFGANTSIHSLSVESTTNGVRKVHLNGYQNDNSQALGAVTDAAVKAALQSVRP